MQSTWVYLLFPALQLFSAALQFSAAALQFYIAALQFPAPHFFRAAWQFVAVALKITRCSWVLFSNLGLANLGLQTSDFRCPIPGAFGRLTTCPESQISEN